MVSPPMFIVFYAIQRRKRKTEKPNAIHPPPVEVGDFWLIYVKNGRNRAQSHFSQSIMDSVKTDRSPPLFLEFHEWNAFHSLFLLIEGLG
ncbi:hypothetical protein IB49_08830 [Geobacillus sp. LC300]|nr:hypothetical protein IB49_08830 [Geobacillus sp. LC300]